MPYGESFHVELQWTATETQPGKVHFQVAGGIVFEKRVLVAGIIKRATFEVKFVEGFVLLHHCILLEPKSTGPKLLMSSLNCMQPLPRMT